jgi:HSP20 family protein
VDCRAQEVSHHGLSPMDPEGESQSFQDEMNRLFNQFFQGGTGEEASWGGRTWTPPVDIYETDEALILKAELPGVSKNDVSIEIHQNTLVLRGQRRHEAEVKEDRYHRVERAYGSFQRSFMLPTLVDQEHVRATYRDGVLELRLPKSEATKPKRVAITG